MKIVISPANYNDAIELCQNNLDILLVGSNEFATRNVYDCNLNDLKEIIKNKKNTKIWVNVNSFFYEPQIPSLEQYLKELSKLDIDRVVFNDCAVPQINKELDLGLKLHYNPSTLITSFGQFEFYNRNKFASVSIANELFLPEVKTLAVNKPNNLELLIQVQGYVLIMHSRWNLVTNFKDYVNDIKDEYLRNKVIRIREETRLYHNHIYEDQNGTHMFTGYELCLIKYLKQFSELKIDYIFIDNILQKDDKYNSIMLSIYQDAIKAINENNFDNEVDSLYKRCLDNANDIDKISAGFIGGIKEIKHYEAK